MIPIVRIRDKNAIPAKYRGKGKQRMEDLLLKAWRTSQQNPEEKLSFKAAYWKASKEQLKAESHQKCAYCECNTSVVAHGDVEHYRPKSVYWWLVYTYDNYLYACQICNQVYKNDRFKIAAVEFPHPPLHAQSTDAEIAQLVGRISPDPLDVNSGYSLQQYIDFHLAEGALLINPYFDDPARYFAYEADDTKQEVKLTARKPEFEPHAMAVDEFYGINRPELKSFRYTVYKQFRTFKRAWVAIDDINLKAEIANQIADMLDAKYLFAGMNRYFNEVLG